MKLKPISEQVVVVMGASSGIGRETALQFARRGARVVVAARGEPGLSSLVDEVRRDGGTAVYQVADVSDYAQVAQTADRAVAEYGHLDTWVHAAAVAEYARFEDMTPDEWRRIIEVNLVGQAYGAMAALPHLKREGRGALIHVSSVTAKRGYPLQSAYCAAKHGIDGFLESLRVELAHDKVPVSVTQILPASINTPFFDHALSKMGVAPAAPPPVYDPSTVADVILYAAEHPSRDLLAGGAARMQIAMQKLSPRLMDALFATTLLGYRSQERPDRPKLPDAPHNMYAPIAGEYQVEGTITPRPQKSLYNWLETHPVARAGVLAGMLAAVVGVAVLQSARRGD